SFSIDDLTESGLRQREALQMAKLMSWSPLEDSEQSEMIEITTTVGKMYSCPVGTGRALQPGPRTPPELIEKFYNCARYSVKPLSTKALEEVVQFVDQLEQVDDVSELLQKVSNSR